MPVSLYLAVLPSRIEDSAVWGMVPLQSAGAGNIAAIARLLEEVAASRGLPPPPPFPDAGTVFGLVELSGFEIPADGVRTVAQRWLFSRRELIALLRTQASLAITKHASTSALKRSLMLSPHG